MDGTYARQRRMQRVVGQIEVLRDMPDYPDAELAEAHRLRLELRLERSLLYLLMASGP